MRQRGRVFRDGRQWRIRYREIADGRRVQRSQAVGPVNMQRIDAQRRADQMILFPLDRWDQHPGWMRLEEFIRVYYMPHLANRKRSTQKSYRSLLARAVLPGLGHLTLAEITRATVGLWIEECRKVLTAAQLLAARKVLQAIFTHAEKRVGVYPGPNPARFVEIAKPRPKPAAWYSIEQAAALLRELPPVMFEAVLLDLTTGLRKGELLGLRWCRLNFTETPRVVDGEVIPPASGVLRESWGLGQYSDTLKTDLSKRTFSLSPEVIDALARLRILSRFSADSDPVFPSTSGRPFSEATAARIFSRLGTRLGFPVRWHIFRHTFATWLDDRDVPMADRIAMLGHARASMTMHYTHADLNRRRGPVSEIAGELARAYVQ